MEFPTIKRIPLAIYTSIAGAFLFYSLYRIYVFFHFIEKELLKPGFSFIAADFQKGWLSEIIFFVIILCCSVLWALIYYVLFKNSHTVFPGILSGLFVLGALLLAGWFFEWRIDPAVLKTRTIVSLFSLFILYGLFTGYSISYEEPYKVNQPEK
ncbi:YqhR family membrane protein [Jeotgalibacillus haloalkalitolerans]|uniref:YqhR family membrane protein n=1 Tax=Jeotgalibacillus haloalkalitolerans TaxID=3104292 RepID=A0ABU5KLW3_9BACL|nr:YqhR family membrane protein [Jeotgalibacillus sp. HH7-29]MDZ5712139.1 YqhR family membrane protein [Jeotgalibacillus sp. HH7-29]